MRPTHRISRALTFALGLTGLTGLTKPTFAADAPAAAFLNELDALRQAAGIPGLSVAVLHRQQLVLAAGLGSADGQQVPATAETPYDIASVTKPISAVLILRLVQEGVLDLDRPLAEYSAWAEFCRDFAAQPGVFSRDLRCDGPPHTLRHLLSHRVAGVPGEAFSYNPVVFSWASRPVMAATGEAYSNLFTRWIFAPAGMHHSARRNRNLPLPAPLAAALAVPHGPDAAGKIVRSAGPSPQGDGAAGGVISTVLDLARFDVALDRGELLSAALREQLWAPGRNSAGQVLPYGLGWFVQTLDGHRAVWHTGLWEGAYSALYLKVLDLDLTLILLANSDGLRWDNPLDGAFIERSPFVAAFLRLWAQGAGGKTPTVKPLG